MYYKDELDKKERRKIVAVTAVLATIILALIVAIVVVGVKKQTGNEIATETVNTEFVPEDNIDSKETDADEQTEEKAEVVVENNAVAGTITEPEETQSNSSELTPIVSESLPKTGPENSLAFAAISGILVTAITAVAMRKKQI